MTLHARKASREVGVRELHDHLSKYLRQVAEGEEVLVTMRGRRIARLTPVETVDPLAALRERGLVQEATKPRRRSIGPRIKVSGSVSELVAEQRR